MSSDGSNIFRYLVSFIAGAFTLLFTLPYFSPHLAPPLTPVSLPPKVLYDTIINSVAHLDAVLTTVTPPNLLLFRHAMGYLHTVELYTAASLQIADIIYDVESASSSSSTVSSSSSNAAGTTAIYLAEKITNCTTADKNDEPASCSALALRLTRLLRACAAYGVFKENLVTSTWTNTLLSSYLRINHPDSLRAVILNFGGVQYRMMAAMPESIISGTASFQKVFNQEFWSWYEDHPTEHGIFDATMAQLGRLGGADHAIASDVPWDKLVNVIVDVGGGFGEMTASIVRENKKLERGYIFDMPHVIERSAQLWRKGRWSKITPPPNSDAAAIVRGGRFNPASEDGLTSRVELHPGDMFNASTFPSVVNRLEQNYQKFKANYPLGDSTTSLDKCTHDAAPRFGFVLRDILHDWSDIDSIRILQSLRKNMRGNETVCYGTDGSKTVRTAPVAHQYKDRVFIVARIIVPGANFVKSMGTTDADIVMMGAFGTTAGERTVEHFTRLFTAADLELVTVHPTRSHYSVLEVKTKPTPVGWGFTGTGLREKLPPGTVPPVIKKEKNVPVTTNPTEKKPEVSTTISNGEENSNHDVPKSSLSSTEPVPGEDDIHNVPVSSDDNAPAVTETNENTNEL